MFEIVFAMIATALSASVDGSAANQIQGVIFFIFVMFLPLAVALVVLSKLADILPFLRRVIPWI